MSRIVKITRLYTKSGSVYEVRENEAGEFFFGAIKVAQFRFRALEGRYITIMRPRPWPAWKGWRFEVHSNEPLMPTSDKHSLSTSPVVEIEEVPVGVE